MWSLATLTTLFAAASAAPLLEKRLAFDYNGNKVYGVNLGGWFVLEPWITPSMFNDGSSADEYSLCKALGGNAQSVMSNHWNSWITQGDFNSIAAAGLNHVRIPVGYWAVDPQPGDPYVQGQLDVLDKAIGWARGAGLKVMIDLHGAPGSQNGFDNSGHKGAIDWQSTDPGASNTINAIKALTQRYAQDTDVVTLIELINEPLGTNPSISMDGVKKYFYDGWGAVRQYAGDTGVVIHDSFQTPLNYWNGFMTSGTNNVMLDTHQYQVFNQDQLKLDIAGHVQAACGVGGQLSSTDKWTVVGEWTGAMTDCAKWLNGYGMGSRYDGTFDNTYTSSCNGFSTGSVASLSDSQRSDMRQYIEAQLDAYTTKSGWFFWTWKTEGAPGWDLSDLIANKVFPQPITDRQHAGQCS